MADSLSCPRCNSKLSRVIETREITFRGQYIKMRVRECRHCKKRFKSKEIVDQTLRYSDKREKERDDKDEDLPDTYNPYTGN